MEPILFADPLRRLSNLPSSASKPGAALRIAPAFDLTGAARLVALSACAAVLVFASTAAMPAYLAPTVASVEAAAISAGAHP